MPSRSMAGLGDCPSFEIPAGRPRFRHGMNERRKTSRAFRARTRFSARRSLYHNKSHGELQGLFRRFPPDFGGNFAPCQSPRLAGEASGQSGAGRQSPRLAGKARTDSPVLGQRHSPARKKRGFSANFTLDNAGFLYYIKERDFLPPQRQRGAIDQGKGAKEYGNQEILRFRLQSGRTGR